MSIREDILLSLEGEKPDKIPFTMYMGSGNGPFCKLIPYGETGRYLRNKGLGIAYRTPLYSIASEDFEIIEKRYFQDDYLMISTSWRSKKGEVNQLSKIEKGFGSEFVVEHFIKKDIDYVVIEDIIKNQIYIPEYSKITQIKDDIGNDGIVMVRLDKTPISRLMYELVNIEKMSYDFFDNKPELLSLIDTLNHKYQELIEIASESPAEIIQIPDNITAIMIGKERFKTHYIPLYDEVYEKLKRVGKKLCIHMDGLVAGLAKEINETKNEIIEAFTPPPDGDLPLRLAREMWPEKIIWINFPCSLHLESPEVIKEYTRKILEGINPKNRFLFGATESFNNENIKKNIVTILDILHEY